LLQTFKWIVTASIFPERNFELFLCGTAAEITLIKEVDGRPIGNEGHPITRKLQQFYEDAVHGRNKKHGDWLNFLS